MRLRAMVLLASSFIVPLQSRAAEGTPPKQVVLKMVEAMNRRDFDGLDTVVAENVRRHSQATPGVTVENRDQFKAFLRRDFSAVPDAKQTIDMIFEGGDMVGLLATYRGTQTGQMGPFPPSGKKLELKFVALVRVEDAKVAEIWVEWDNLSALTQLGHLPPPPGKAEESKE